MESGYRAAPGRAPSGGDEVYRQQPPHIRRFIDAMQAIFDDAAKLMETIKRGDPPPADAKTAEPHFSPIRCKGSETLFEHTDQQGVKRYSMYHFTKDFKTVNNGAQIGLYNLYSRVYFANLIISRSASHDPGDVTALKECLDEILAKSAYFINFFRGYNFAADVMSGRASQEEGVERARQLAEDATAKGRAAQKVMFHPEKFSALLPAPRPMFLIAVEEPYQEGQRIINGVYFPPKLAEAMMKELAEKQAQAMSKRTRA